MSLNLIVVTAVPLAFVKADNMIDLQRDLKNH